MSKMPKFRGPIILYAVYYAFEFDSIPSSPIKHRLQRRENINGGIYTYDS